MDSKIKLLAKDFGLEKVKFEENLAPHTALQIGGVVKLFAVAISERELIKLIKGCRTLKIPFLIMGTGSKLMVSDKGFDGVVIKNRTQNIKIISIKGKVSSSWLGVDSVLLETESGVTVSQLANFLKKQGLDSTRFSSLPGTIGGNIFINNDLIQTAETVKVLNLAGIIEIISPTELSLRSHMVLSIVFRVYAISNTRR